MSVNCFLGLYLCVDWFYTVGRNLFIGLGFIFMAVIGVISGIMAGICVSADPLSFLPTIPLANCQHDLLIAGAPSDAVDLARAWLSCFCVY